MGRPAPEEAAANPSQELLETVRMLERQVTLLTEEAERNTRANEEANRRNRRRRTPVEDEDGQGDDEASEDLGRRNSRQF